LWNEDVKNSIIEHKGSIQQLDIIPENIRQKFKIVWEIPMKFIIEMARDRGAFICQSQSLNLWMKDPNYKSLTAMHFFSWKQGLKTGLYYLRSRAKASPQQFTIVPKNNKIEEDNEPPQCEMCSG
jgi:ribonucleotide reductase alpha subunit